MGMYPTPTANEYGSFRMGSAPRAQVDRLGVPPLGARNWNDGHGVADSGSTARGDCAKKGVSHDGPDADGPDPGETLADPASDHKGTAKEGSVGVVVRGRIPVEAASDTEEAVLPGTPLAWGQTTLRLARLHRTRGS